MGEDVETSDKFKQGASPGCLNVASREQRGTYSRSRSAVRSSGTSRTRSRDSRPQLGFCPTTLDPERTGHWTWRLPEPQCRDQKELQRTTGPFEFKVLRQDKEKVLYDEITPRFDALLGLIYFK